MAAKLQHDRRTQQITAASALGLAIAALFVKRRSVTDKAKATLRTPGPMSTPQLEAAMRDLYEPIPGGGRILLVPTSQGRVARVQVYPTKQSTLKSHAADFAPEGFVEVKVPQTPGPNAIKPPGPPDKDKENVKRVGVCVVFRSPLISSFIDHVTATKNSFASSEPSSASSFRERRRKRSSSSAPIPSSS